MENEFVVCQNCGEKNPNRNNYCQKCAVPLREIFEQKVPEQDNQYYQNQKSAMRDENKGSLFKTNSGGFIVEVFPKYIHLSFISTGKTMIPINQIASVEITAMIRQIVIETTGGKKYKTPVPNNEKQKLRDVIFETMTTLSN